MSEIRVVVVLAALLCAPAVLAGLEDADYQVSEIAYNLRDVSESGTEVALGDDEVFGPVPVGFAFGYYGEFYAQAYISSNGFVTFNPASSSGCCSGVAIPTPGGVENFVAGFWEDLNPINGGTVRYQTLGLPPNREFVVGFYQIQHFRPHSPEGNTPVEMEIIFHELSSEIELQYTEATTAGESDHSVGVESAGGLYGTQVDFGTGFSYGMEGRLLVPGGIDGDPDPVARFAVDKVFNDANPAEVNVTISCNTGLPLEQSADISQGDGVVFVVTDFEAGALDCAITETPAPAGYRQVYSPDGGITFPSTDSCEYAEVPHGAANACVVENRLELVLVEVTKTWLDENPELGAFNYAEAGYHCSNEQFGTSAFGTLEFLGDGAVDGFFVYPHWDGTTMCQIDETVIEGGIEADDSACQALGVTPGSGAACEIVNTRLYEGIPTLNRHGLLILVFLVLMLAGRHFLRN